MRLLHLYSGNLYGGIERVLSTLARTRVDGISQAFALFFDRRLARELRESGADMTLIGPASLSRPWTVASSRRALRVVLERAQPDVVLAHSPWTLAIAGPVIERSRCRSALWLHGPLGTSYWPDRWASRHAPEIVFANSPFTATRASRGVNVSTWIYPPVAPALPESRTRRSVTRHRHGALDTDVVILQASRIEEGKGLREHVEALGRLRDEPQWVLWLAGAPQRRSERALLEEIQARAASYGITDRVRFLGHRADVPDLMAGADIYCQPNVSPEPFGVAFIEAMAAGLPIVTSAAGGLASAIDGVTGRVVPAGDPSAIAEALRELVLAPETRASLGGRGPGLAAALCDPEQQLRRLCALLDTA
jgi:glycosyltransferase involved in cell wall biosynthesis